MQQEMKLPTLPVQSVRAIPAMSKGASGFLHALFSTRLFASFLRRHTFRYVVYMFVLLNTQSALTEARPLVCSVGPEGTSPQAVNCPRNLGLELWATPRFPGKRYGYNTSNIVESLKNWVPEERKLSITDLLNALWCKTMASAFNTTKKERGMMQKLFLPSTQ